jgi:phosphotransferase system HPr (HPr) family protein
MGVMMLAAETGATIGVRTEGEDEELAAEKIVEVIESKFD